MTYTVRVKNGEQSMSAEAGALPISITFQNGVTVEVSEITAAVGTPKRAYRRRSRSPVTGQTIDEADAEWERRHIEADLPNSLRRT